MDRGKQIFPRRKGNIDRNSTIPAGPGGERLPHRSLMKAMLIRVQPDVLDHVADGVIVADRDGKVRYLNPAAEKLLGRSSPRLEGHALEELAGPELRALAHRAHEASSPAAHDGLLLGTVPVDAIAAPLEDGGVVLTLRDRTVTRVLEAEARQADRLAALSTVAAGIAHEVKNPLGGIRGAAQLLARGVDDPQKREYLDVIVREVDRIVGLVDRLRDLTLPETTASREPVDVNRLLHELTLLQGATGEGRIELDLDPSLPAVEGDEQELKRLFLNLLRNALEAAKTRVLLSTRVETGRRWRDPSGGLHALVSVSFTDDGDGILPEHRERLFEPFFTTKASGTGLGLAAAQRIVHQHHGTIDVADAPGGGARFVVTMPASRGPT